MPSELAAFGEIASHLANPLVLIGFALLLLFGVHRALIRSGILPPVDQRTSGVIVQSLLRYGFWIAALLIVLGIAYVAYKTYRETQPAIVNAETVNAAIEVLSKQVESKGLREQEYQEQIKALTETVQALAKKQDAPGVKEVLAALAQGKTEAAKAIFAKTVEGKTAEGASANREAAEAARYLGALAFLDNTEEALRWYRRAVELDPANADGWNKLGHLYHRTGQLDQGEAAYRKVVTLGEANGNMAAIAAGTAGLGIIYQTRGELDRADEMHKQALAINEKLGSQEGMASEYGNLGILYETRGELDRAEEMHKKFAVDRGEARQPGGHGRRVRQPRDHLSEAGRAPPGRGDAQAGTGDRGEARPPGGYGQPVRQPRADLPEARRPRAEDMHKKGLAIEEKLGRQQGMAIQYGSLGTLYQTRGDTRPGRGDAQAGARHQ